MQVVHNKEKSEFTIFGNGSKEEEGDSQGRLAYLEYRLEGDSLDAFHTFSHPSMRGKGLAGKVTQR